MSVYTLRARTLSFFFLILVFSVAYANTAPSKPGNLVAVAESDSTISLSWDASIDDKRVKHYRVSVNQIPVAYIRKLRYTVTGLEANTSYQLDVDASDGKAYSYIASVTETTLANESEQPTDPTSIDPTPIDPDPTDPEPINCRGKNKKLPECQEPPAEEPPAEEPPAEEPPAEEPPAEEPPAEEPPAEEPPAEEPPAEEPPAEEPPAEEPPAEEPPAVEPPAEEPPAEEPPAEEPPISGAPPAGWRKVFEDNFDGYGDIDTSSSSKLWRFETMSDPLHRAGNSGLDEFGNLTVHDWQSPNGKRWSGWYNQYNTENAYRSAGNLVMQGFESGEADPTRPNDYYDNGVPTQYGSSKLYTAWLDTWSRKYDNDLEKQITDPASPNKTFKYGYFETRVNFSNMQTPGFRLSMWLMPASIDAEGQFLVESNAYDYDGDNGVEIDIFEYEWISTEYENRLQFSLHGGGAGSSSTNLDTTPLGISLHQDWHTVGLLWQADKLQWILDGQVVKTVTDATLIPDVYSYLIVSREMNSGVKRQGIDAINVGDVLEDFPYRPRDPGMYAQNIWEFKDRLETDRALVDYIRIWQP